MAEDDDDSQKTEEPSQQRIDEAVKKGQVASSKEITSFMVLLSLALIIGSMSSYLLRTSTIKLRHYIERPEDFLLDDGNLGRVLIQLLIDIAPIALLPAFIVIIAAFASSFLQHGGFVVSSHPITPSFDKISPMKGIGRIFSMQSVVEFIKGLIKIIVMGLVAFMSIYPHLGSMSILHLYNIAGILALLLKLSIRMLIGVTVTMALIAILDYLYQRHAYFKGLRMTKQEVKDEYKSTEGSPEIKSKIRAIRMERARKRMMSAVPKADVIITNPTHFSVALRYDVDHMKAPVVVAKGQDNIALKIREVGKKHNVPLIENPPLARALYAAVEIDQEIPFEHYKAVAEIIGYVFKLKGKQA
jgi:flagellar biosynthetic protein FlhB